MHACLPADVSSLRDACSLLGLPCADDGAAGTPDAVALAQAFRAAVKSARPDQPGGDAERFRQVIAAYRLIQSEGAPRPALAPPPPPPPRPAALPVVAVTPMEALAGARVAVTLGPRKLRIAVPAGVRSGERIRLRGASEAGADLYLPLLIRPADGLSVIGDDLYMSWSTPPRLLEDGGRVEVETYAGRRSAWVTPGLQSPVRLRLRDLGLPPRAGHARGHLYVTLEPGEDDLSIAEDLLVRFTRVWTAQPLAA